MLSAFDHVAVPMERVEEMVVFYTALGCRVDSQNNGAIHAVIFGDNKINFHAPSLWKSGQFTLRGPTALIRFPKTTIVPSTMGGPPLPSMMVAPTIAVARSMT